MRIHLVVAVYVLLFSVFYRLSAVEYAVLFLVIGTVFCTEALNTAVEVIVNLQTQCYDNLARIAKDVAAGAVFISAFFAVAVGCIFFIRPQTLAFIFNYLVSRPALGVLFLASVPAAVAFIFRFPFCGRRAPRPPVHLKKNGRG